MMVDIKTDEDMIPTSTAKHDRCFLLELPQELLEIICDYAYQFPGQHAIIWRKVWERRELERRVGNPDYAITPFPSPKINDLLVSKKFFITAAKSYASRGRFAFENLRISHTILHSGGIFRQWVSSLALQQSELHQLKRRSFVALRDVRLSLSPHCFYDLDPGATYLRDCCDQELKSAMAYLTTTTFLVGLRQIKIIPCFERGTRGHQEQFAANLKRFEDLVKPIVLEPLSEETDAMSSPATLPLYVGSAVQLENSVLVLPEDPFSVSQRRVERSQTKLEESMCLIKGLPKHQEWQQGVGTNNTGPSDIALEHSTLSGAQAITRRPRLLRVAKSLEDIDIPDSLEDVMTMLGEDRDRVSRYLLRSKGRKERDTSKFAEMLSTPRIEWDGVKLMDPIPHRLKPIAIQLERPAETVHANAAAQANSETPGIAVSQHRDRSLDPADGRVGKADAKPSRYRKAEAVTATNSNEPQNDIPDHHIQHGHSHLPRSLTVADLLAEEQEGWGELHDMRQAFDLNEDEDDDSPPSEPSAIDIPKEQVFELPSNPTTRDPVFPQSRPMPTRSQYLVEIMPALQQLGAKLNSRKLSANTANSPPQRYADTLRAQANQRGHAGNSLPSSSTMPDLRVGQEEKRKWKKPLSLAIKQMVQKKTRKN